MVLIKIYVTVLQIRVIRHCVVKNGSAHVEVATGRHWNCVHCMHIINIKRKLIR